MKKKPAPEGDRLISGKLRSREGRQGARNLTVVVDGTEYAWSVRHGWQPWGKGIRVISVSVALHPARTRELILDLTLSLSDQSAPPADDRVKVALPDAIRAAIDAGWDPESRGRAFRHEIEARL